MLKLAQAEIVGILRHQQKEVFKPSSYQHDTRWNQRIFFHLCICIYTKQAKAYLVRNTSYAI